jgi:hypothetical protein
MGVGAKVSVVGARVGDVMSMGSVVGETAEIVAGAGTSTGTAEGSVQAVNRKIRVNEVARKFFIAVYVVVNPFSIP